VIVRLPLTKPWLYSQWKSLYRA